MSTMPRFSLIVPVYKNISCLSTLLLALRLLQIKHDNDFETVLVVDGCPEGCYDWLYLNLPQSGLNAQLVLHSRNFGSFAAIRSGLSVARGSLFAVISADLQEPPALVSQFFSVLTDKTHPVDIVLGARNNRADPFWSKLASQLFWSMYRRFVQPEMPAGGIDLFGCNRQFRDRLLSLPERNSSLVGLIVWLGFRRRIIGYDRLAREHGLSAWTFRRKFNYLLDSVFAFSDLPLKLLMLVGGFAMVVALTMGLAALIAKLTGHIQVPGYTMLIIAISFFGALNTFALGVVGSYVWRAFENTKARPIAVISAQHVFEAAE